MAKCHRKFRIFDENCHDLPPPPPPPPPPMSSDHPFSPILIFMFCGLTVSFTFICYLVFATRYRRRLRTLEFTETHEDLVNQDLGPVIHHPIWLINTIGLDQSQIESIDVFKYKKDQGLIEGTDCPVCLSEFEDDESLRLLPKCGHAFHVPCIDTWLRSHKNCPLCRAPIFKNTSEQTESTTTGSHSIEARTTEETPDSETVDHQVIEVEGNGEVEKSRRILEEISSGARVRSDLVDHHRVHGERSVAPLPMRRSASMDMTSASMVGSMSKKPSSMPKSGEKLKGSSSSFRIYSKAMKSCSFGHSSQKASSFTNKSAHNRSY